jgi:hypothetical protein
MTRALGVACQCIRRTSASSRSRPKEIVNAIVGKVRRRRARGEPAAQRAISAPVGTGRRRDVRLGTESLAMAAPAAFEHARGEISDGGTNLAAMAARSAADAPLEPKREHARIFTAERDSVTRESRVTGVTRGVTVTGVTLRARAFFPSETLS